MACARMTTLPTTTVKSNTSPTSECQTLMNNHSIMSPPFRDRLCRTHESPATIDGANATIRNRSRFERTPTTPRSHHQNHAEADHEDPDRAEDPDARTGHRKRRTADHTRCRTGAGAGVRRTGAGQRVRRVGGLTLRDLDGRRAELARVIALDAVLRLGTLLALCPVRPLPVLDAAGRGLTVEEVLPPAGGERVLDRHVGPVDRLTVDVAAVRLERPTGDVERALALEVSGQAVRGLERTGVDERHLVAVLELNDLGRPVEGVTRPGRSSAVGRGDHMHGDGRLARECRGSEQQGGKTHQERETRQDLLHEYIFLSMNGADESCRSRSSPSNMEAREPYWRKQGYLLNTPRGCAFRGPNRTGAPSLPQTQHKRPYAASTDYCLIQAFQPVVLNTFPFLRVVRLLSFSLSMTPLSMYS